MRAKLTLLSLLLLSSLQVQPAAVALSEDYICASGHTQESLQLTRWLPEEFPLKVYIPPISIKGVSSANYTAWLKEAYGAWTKQLPGLRFTYVNSPQEASMLIQWRESFDPEDPAWGKAFLPIPLINKQTRKIKHRTAIMLATKAQVGSGFSVTEPVPFSRDEFVAIATHEIGHALGLLHSDSEGDLMYPAIMRLTAASQWALSPRDVLTLKRIYALPRNIKTNPCPR